MWLRGVFALCTFFLSSLEHRCDGSSDCGGCWLFCCPVLNTAAPVVQTVGGGVLVYIEPMYRDPSRGPCIGTIYPTLLGFGGIHLIIPSYIMYCVVKFVCFSVVKTLFLLQDLNLSTERLTSNKAFTNKLWNAGKFLLQNLPDRSDVSAWDALLANKVPN